MHGTIFCACNIIVGKYYLTDSGYPNIKEFLIPYKKTRYHLPDFRQTKVIRSSNENFNYVHSSLRSVIERTFSILKARFSILKGMSRFDMTTQIKIIWASITIHNYLHRKDANDLYLLGVVKVNKGCQIEADLTSRFSEPQAEDAWMMNHLRDTIRDGLRIRTVED